MKINEVISPNRPTLHTPIAPSGAGKTTLLRRLQAKNPDILVFSLDLLRHEWYNPNDYATAWQASTEDRDFGKKANQRFLEMIKTGKDIYVDNTNLTPRSRGFYLQEARKRGYRTIAYLLPVDVKTLLARRATRKDKSVPEEAVLRQFAALKSPTEGEFDDIVTINGNEKQNA